MKSFKCQNFASLNLMYHIIHSQASFPLPNFPKYFNTWKPDEEDLYQNRHHIPTATNLKFLHLMKTFVAETLY